MKLHCPHCGVKGTADDSFVGRKVRCPKCQGTFEAGEAPDIDQVSEPVVEQVVEREVETVQQSETPSPEQPGFPNIKIAPPSPVIPQTREEIPEEPREAEADTLDWSDLEKEIEQETKEDVQEERLELPDDFVTEVPPAALSDIDEEGPVASLSQADEDGSLDSDFDNTGESAVAETTGEASASVIDPEDGTEEILSVDLSDELEPESKDEEATEVADETTEPTEIEDKPYGLEGQQCWQCGKKDTGEDPFIAKDGRLYCSDCLPDEDFDTAGEQVPPVGGIDAGSEEKATTDNPAFKFTVFGAIREAWRKTRGVKGSIWMGSAIMYLVILVLTAGGAYLLPEFDPATPDMAALSSNLIFQVVIEALSVLFTAGLLVVGIRHVVGKPISWNMVFDGFPMAARIILATILQTLLIVIGCLLLILPGIYLMVGYSLTLPLIVDKQMGAWQAMEASRKAVHKVWWRVFGVFLLMSVIFVLSLLPLGIGIIWTWPMFLVLLGVLYRYLFGRTNIAG